MPSSSRNLGGISAVRTAPKSFRGVTWPLQSQCNAFYGNPLKNGIVDPVWERNNIVYIKPPFQCFYGAIPVSRIATHKKTADAFMAWYEQIWANAEKKQFAINAWGMSSFSGSFNPRLKRGGTTLSMHGYACAEDWDAPRNAFGDKTPNFATPTIYQAVVKPFLDLGGTWGGTWDKPDGMHFQFARVG